MTCLKVLLIPSYRSTDFEVHRNWLAVTHSLPLSQWYVDTTSQWTLDYPPLFAWFEYALSHIAKFVDPKMLDVNSLEYESPATVVFQRFTVIFSDFVLYIGVQMCADQVPVKDKSSPHSPRAKLGLLLLTSPALLLVDHVHFQYNGVLLGLLLISIALMSQGRHLLSALVFTVLLNMKHIFLYVAPSFFVFLLRERCLRVVGGAPWWSSVRVNFRATLSLAIVVLAVFTVSFAPFVALGQLPQVLSRLFPFKRGLCHAYWAPNVWALYSALDRALVLTARALGVSVQTPVAALTGGLVQDTSTTLLPSVRPWLTLVLTVCAQLPALHALWRSPREPAALARCLTHCALASFLLGWHVHEKAILLVLAPLAVLGLYSDRYLRLYCHLASVANISLLPLLPVASYHTPFKLMLCTAHALLMSLCFPVWSVGGARVPTVVYGAILVGVTAYSEVLHVLFPWHARLPYLPLLLVSTSCALPVLYVGVIMLRQCWLGLRTTGGRRVDGKETTAGKVRVD